MTHIPVLQKEVIQYLAPEPNENFIDGTIGEGGHTLALLEKNGPKGKVLGIDADPEIIKNTKYYIQNTPYKKRIILVCDNFVNLREITKKEGFHSVSGILFDLGMSSWHLETSNRGFSFLRNEPLDMRYNPQNPLTAEKILNFWSETEIEKILKEFGEERFAQIIAKGIVKERRINPIKTTSYLVKIIEKVIPNRYKHQRIHFATRTFQALRIAVNDELNNLEKALPQAMEILNRNGRLVVISFHSLEDRIVKNFYRGRVEGPAEGGRVVGGLSSVDLKILTKKPIGPTKEEIKINPRSRSAKLRAAIKVDESKD